MYSAFPSADFPSNPSTSSPPTSTSSSSLAYYDNSASLYSHDSYNSNNSQLNHPSASSHAPSTSSSSLFGSMDSTSSPSSTLDDDRPLLEELGINPKEIFQRTLAVSLPFAPLPPQDAQDSADLAGPFVFCLLLGSCLLLHGKVHFGYIYGFGVTSCLLMYFIINLMSTQPISVERTTSILGYALVPLVFLAVAVVFVDFKGIMGGVCAGLVIGWCTVNATRLFESSLHMREQRYLIAYPVAIIYACFGLLTVF